MQDAGSTEVASQVKEPPQEAGRAARVPQTGDRNALPALPSCVGSQPAAPPGVACEHAPLAPPARLAPSFHPCQGGRGLSRLVGQTIDQGQ